MIDKSFICQRKTGDSIHIKYSEDGDKVIWIVEEEYPNLVALSKEQMIELRDALNEEFPDEDAYYEAKEARERRCD